MKKRKRLSGVLLIIAALIIMQLPVSEADAATSSASDFKMEGSTLVKYRGTEKNVSVPDTVEVVGKGAFEDNANIELVVLPNSVKRIEEYAFWGCGKLDTVVLGKGLSEVGDYAFAGCKGLTQMSLPSNVTSVGVQAFGDCVNLKDISIPPETVSIHESAFDGCYQLTIHCEEGSAADVFAKSFYEKQKEMPEYQDVPGYDPSGDTEDAPGASAVPEGTAEPWQTAAPAQTGEPEATAVPTAAPEGTSAPAEGQELGTSRIVGNRAVVFLDRARANVYDAEKPAVSQPPAADFSGGAQGSGIPKFTIVDGSVVADQAYYRSQDLETVTLPDGIREIGQFAYARSSLREAVLPQGVETVSYGAFYHCDSLEDIELPDTVMLVEPKAFDHTAWKDRFLSGSAGQGDFLISGGVLAAYRGEAADVSIPEGVRVIAAEVFQGHEEIASVTMPKSLRVIGEGAFEDCTGLAEISLNVGLEQVKDRAFLNCGADLVRVPSTVQSVGLRAFEGMDADYGMGEPDSTYEVSATRLSNEAYRAPQEDADAVADGVVVEEPDGASAVLEGAQRTYVLRIGESQEEKPMQKAFQRVFGRQLPDGSYVCDMLLTDNSGIPLSKLGRQLLTVALPVPPALAGQEVRLFGLDRNGQLEEMAVEIIRSDGETALRFSTNTLSQIAFCPTGNLAGEPVEASVDMGTSLSAPPEAAAGIGVVWVKALVGGAVLLTGVVLFLQGLSAGRAGK